jgi:hypothetical protein
MQQTPPAPVPNYEVMEQQVPETPIPEDVGTQLTFPGMEQNNIPQTGIRTTKWKRI